VNKTELRILDEVWKGMRGWTRGTLRG